MIDTPSLCRNLSVHLLIIFAIIQVHSTQYTSQLIQSLFAPACPQPLSRLGLLVVKLLLRLAPHADVSKLSNTPCSPNPLALLPCLLCPNVGVVGDDRVKPGYDVSMDPNLVARIGLVAGESS